MLPSWAKVTVTRVRQSIKLVRGSEIPDWSNPFLLDIEGCSMQPSSTMLSQDGRVQGVTDGYTCYLPPGSDVKAGDRIRFAGEDYTIIGKPRIWESPTGLVSSVQLELERWRG